MQAIFPVMLLIMSNVFMTLAWYGHLKYTSKSLILVILVSWGIAFFEYCLQVPANRIGYRYYSVVELKVMQEVISLTVFGFFAVLYLKESLRWNYIVGFCFLVLAVFFVFKKW